jgi:hypothetical protein
MGILGHAWDAATSFLPMGVGGIVNKLGREAASKIKENPGIIGKIGGNMARAFVPKKYRKAASTIANTALKIIPEGKIKNVLTKINDEAQNPNLLKTNEYNKSSSVISSGPNVYGSFTKGNPRTAFESGKSQPNGNDLVKRGFTIPKTRTD